MKNKKIAYRFRIELSGIKPLIWRLIEVPSTYTFWDLHVAIQDAMGWLDYHLHSFTFFVSGNDKPILVGIPDDEYEDNTLPGWGILIGSFFREPYDEVLYEYDFGDGWEHRVVLEGIYIQEKEKKYPHCLDGKRACPPEDCGGVHGYYNLLEILGDKKHAEHKDMISWLKGHAKNYYPYNPEHFDPKEVKFSDPKKRWKMAFQS